MDTELMSTTISSRISRTARSLNTSMWFSMSIKKYKDLHIEKSTSENDLGVAPRSTPEQQSVADSGFIEFEDALVDKARNIPEGNVESRVAPPTP